MKMTKEHVGKWCAIDLKDVGIVAALLIEEPQILPDHYATYSPYCKIFIPETNECRRFPYGDILFLGDKLTIPNDIETLFVKARKQKIKNDKMRNQHGYMLQGGKMVKLF